MFNGDLKINRLLISKTVLSLVALNEYFLMLQL